jgi:hypothetical protein
LPKEISPFDFMNAASFSKDDVINNHENPEMAEQLYTPYIVNRGFANFQDTILHANEMNMRADLFKDAQFQYYRGALRKRKRFSKWPKADKSNDLDAIQLYLKALSSDDLKSIHNKMSVGGVSK